MIDSIYITICRTDLHTIEQMSPHKYTKDDDSGCGNSNDDNIVRMMKCERLTECTQQSRQQKVNPVIVFSRHKASHSHRIISQCSVRHVSTTKVNQIKKERIMCE